MVRGEPPAWRAGGCTGPPVPRGREPGRAVQGLLRPEALAPRLLSGGGGTGRLVWAEWDSEPVRKAQEKGRRSKGYRVDFLLGVRGKGHLPVGSPVRGNCSSVSLFQGEAETVSRGLAAGICPRKGHLLSELNGKRP